MPKSRIFLLDGHALCYRSFYAVKELINSKGQPTNAIFGFMNIFRKILRQYDPSHLAVCFDSGKPSRRIEKLKDYKIHRPSMPDELRSQMPIIRQIIEGYHIPIYEMDGYEADDILATLALKLQDKHDVVIVSDDKDMYQIVNDNIKLYNSRKDRILDAKDVEEKFGVAPEYVADWLGLAGDSSDNIPGVKGVGEVTARKLIQQLGSVENIVERADEIASAKVKEKIVAEKDVALLSKELATLEDVPIKFKADDLKRQNPDNKILYDLFKELEFRQWLKEFDSGEAGTEAQEQAVKEVALDELIKAWTKNKQGSVLIEDDTFVLGAEAAFAKCSILELSAVTPFLTDTQFELIAFDVKELRHALHAQNIDVTCTWFDVQLASFILFSGKTQMDIPSLAWASIAVGADEPHIGWQTSVLLNMKPALTKMLKDEKLDDLYDDLEKPLSDVLYHMEKVGVSLDQDTLKTLSDYCTKEIQTLQENIFKEAGEEFNIKSPKQLGVVLFEKLELPPIKKTKTGFSTNEEVLHRLAPLHPLPQMILDYRQLTKLQSTYIDALPALVNPQDQRIHARFHQTGAETGRLSSSHPNLQNIPIRTELGRKIRQAFVASSKDHVLISADYSQIELRILAHLANDEDLIQAFKDGDDIHNFTGAQIFDVKQSEVDRDMRTMAKRVNFGIVYGISAFGLAKDLGVSQKEAQDFIDRYFARYPKVKAFMDHEIQKAREQGYVQTLLNRRRYIPEIKNRNVNLRHFAERQAINTPVQGTAADMMKLAMINIAKELTKQQKQSVMTITVHDEVVLDVLKEEQQDIADIVKAQMEQAFELSVPIEVTVKAGDNWLDMKEIHS